MTAEPQPTKEEQDILDFLILPSEFELCQTIAMEALDKIVAFHTPAKSKQEIREQVLDEFKWMRPMCFGRHEAICDTRCAWAVRKRCVAELRSKQGGEP